MNKENKKIMINSNMLDDKVKKLKEDSLEIVKVVFELNSLIMEMPYCDQPNQKVLKKLVEKYKSIYDKCDNNAREVYELENQLDNNSKEYYTQFNIYLNATSTFSFITSNYLENYRNKYEQDDDINDIFDYFTKISQITDLITRFYPQIIMNLDEEYYNF